MARPADELPSSVGMTVTRAVPSRRHSAGAVALRTPSTVASTLGDLGGVAVADERVEGRERPGADAGSPAAARAPARAGPPWASESARGLPSWIVEAATTSAARTAVAETAAIQRWRTTRRAHADQPRLAGAAARRRGRSRRGPTVASTTGRSVVATATLTPAISSPAIPMLRMNGTGRATSASSEIATVVPLNTTDEPACRMALRTATSFDTAGVLALLAPAGHDQEGVVDRDAEPDERDEELHDHGDVGDAGQRPHEQEGRRDRDQRHQQRHERHERAEDEDQDDQRTERADERLHQHAGAAAAVGRRGAQGVEAGDLDGGAADGDAGERRPAPAGPPPVPG